MVRSSLILKSPFSGFSSQSGYTNHAQPDTTTHNYPQTDTTTHNQSQPATTTNNHPQPPTISHNQLQQPTTTHNNPQPPKNYPKKPQLVTNGLLLHLDVNTETEVDFHSGMKQYI